MAPFTSSLRAPSTLMILTGLLTGGCGPQEAPLADAGAPHECPDPHAIEQAHECVPYTPMSTGGVLSGTWAMQNDEVTHSITVPAEAGGGMVELHIDSAPAGPALIVEVAGVTTASISSSGVPAGKTSMSLRFEAAGGQSFDVTAKSNWNATPDQYPLNYTLTWSYEGREDCYEPNDVREEAKLIPFNQVLTARLGYNRASNYHTAPEHHDWYRFELLEPRTVAFELLSGPSDVDVALHAWGSAPGTIGSGSGKPASEGNSMSLGELAPGMYFVQVEAAGFHEDGVSKNEEPVSDHFRTPYTFRLDVE